MGRNTPIPPMSEEDKRFVRGLVLYEDEAILVFDKPPGLPTQTRGARERNLDDLLWAFARSNGKRPHFVHRLDAGTSGLLVAAKTKPVAAMLNEAFATRRVRKTYIALVGGKVPEASSGRIERHLASERVAGRERIVAVEPDAPGARPAITHWRVLARTEHRAAMELKPETGRTHQIRVHLASLGCPILGDATYGHGQLTAPRLMLHAAELSLEDPGKSFDLACAPHEDMSVLASQLLGYSL